MAPFRHRIVAAGAAADVAGAYAPQVEVSDPTTALFLHYPTAVGTPSGRLGATASPAIVS
jgi:hypothetical protein